MRLLRTDAVPNSLAWLVASTTLLSQPFMGGTLVPTPQLVQLFITDPLGEVSVLGIPGGAGPVGVYVQFVVQDLSQPADFALSNALQVQLLP